MSEGRDSWRDTLRAVGDAAVDVLTAEMEVLTEVWGRSAKELGKALALFVAVALIQIALAFGGRTR